MNNFGLPIVDGNTVIARADGTTAIADPVTAAAIRVGATPADIPGLWTLPGYPELTSGQLLQIAR